MRSIVIYYLCALANTRAMTTNRRSDDDLEQLSKLLSEVGPALNHEPGITTLDRMADDWRPSTSGVTRDEGVTVESRGSSSKAVVSGKNEMVSMKYNIIELVEL